jgi:signal transduction histidine kinase
MVGRAMSPRLNRAPATAIVLDAAVAIAATAGIQHAVWSGRIHGRPGLLAVLFLPGAVALLWRRRAPHFFIVLFCGAIAIQAVSTSDAPEGAALVLPIIVGLYSLGAYGTPRQALLAWPVLLAGIVLQTANDRALGNDAWAAAFWVLVPLGAYAVGLIARGRRQAATLRAQAARGQIEREVAARAAVAEERARIARELHDAVAHSVSVTVIHAEAAEAVLPPGDSAPARASLHRIQASGREALTEMRRLLELLRTPEGEDDLAPQPGAADLQRLAEQMTDAGLPVELVMACDLAQLPPGIDISAYRIAQEALTNSLKHGASQARVELRRDRTTLVIDVLDRGTSPSARDRAGTPLSGGQGLIGMQERVDFFGGDLTAAPCEGGGFRVRARFPLPEVTAS